MVKLLFHLLLLIVMALSLNIIISDSMAEEPNQTCEQNDGGLPIYLQKKVCYSLCIYKR